MGKEKREKLIRGRQKDGKTERQKDGKTERRKDGKTGDSICGVERRQLLPFAPPLLLPSTSLVASYQTIDQLDAHIAQAVWSRVSSHDPKESDVGSRPCSAFLVRV